MHESLLKIMPEHLVKALNVGQLTEEQQELLFKWGMHMYSLGQHIVADIDEVKYDGHVVVLDDGTRWEVDDIDTTTAEMWGPLDKVLVVDGEMWKLDENEKVSVTEES